MCNGHEGLAVRRGDGETPLMSACLVPSTVPEVTQVAERLVPGQSGRTGRGWQDLV